MIDWLMTFMGLFAKNLENLLFSKNVVIGWSFSKCPSSSSRNVSVSLFFFFLSFFLNARNLWSRTSKFSYLNYILRNWKVFSKSYLFSTFFVVFRLTAVSSGPWTTSGLWFLAVFQIISFFTRNFRNSRRGRRYFRIVHSTKLLPSYLSRDFNPWQMSRGQYWQECILNCSVRLNMASDETSGFLCNFPALLALVIIG